MTLKVVHGNLLESVSDAIILTVDGAAKGMEGNIARAFARKWPEIREDMEEEVHYPIPLGRSVGYTVPSSLTCPYKKIIISSTLHHLDVLTDDQKNHVIRSAFSQAIQIAVASGCRSVSTAIMTGGWRLPLEEAFIVMLRASENISGSGTATPDVCLYVLNKEHFKEVECLSVKLGYAVEISETVLKLAREKMSMKKCPVGLPRYLSCSALQNAISELDNEVDMSRQQKD